MLWVIRQTLAYNDLLDPSPSMITYGLTDAFQIAHWHSSQSCLVTESLKFLILLCWLTRPVV